MQSSSFMILLLLSGVFLSHKPPRVIVRPFAFDVFGGLHDDAVDLLARLRGVVSQGSVSHEGLVWFSTIARVGFTVARAMVGSL